MNDETVAWRATPYRAPVVDTSGAVIGTTESLLGDDSADIFHGLAVKRARDGELVEIPAAMITRITTARVYTSVVPDEVASLQPYRTQQWFHLGWGGLFAKHRDWPRFNP